MYPNCLRQMQRQVWWKNVLITVEFDRQTKHSCLVKKTCALQALSREILRLAVNNGVEPHTGGQIEQRLSWQLSGWHKINHKIFKRNDEALVPPKSICDVGQLGQKKKTEQELCFSFAPPPRHSRCRCLKCQIKKVKVTCKLMVFCTCPSSVSTEVISQQKGLTVQSFSGKQW